MYGVYEWTLTGLYLMLLFGAGAASLLCGITMSLLAALSKYYGTPTGTVTAGGGALIAVIYLHMCDPACSARNMQTHPSILGLSTCSARLQVTPTLARSGHLIVWR